MLIIVKKILSNGCGMKDNIRDLLNSFLKIEELKWYILKT